MTEYELAQDRFYNACMILLNLDMHELVDAGIIASGNADTGLSSWLRFTRDPLVFIAKIDDEKRDKLFALINSRQSKRLTLQSPNEGEAK